MASGLAIISCKEKPETERKEKGSGSRPEMSWGLKETLTWRTAAVISRWKPHSLDERKGSKGGRSCQFQQGNRMLLMGGYSRFMKAIYQGRVDRFSILNWYCRNGMNSLESFSQRGDLIAGRDIGDKTRKGSPSRQCGGQYIFRFRGSLILILKLKHILSVIL